MRLKKLVCLVGLALPLLASPGRAEDARPLAVFPVELWDTSLEGPKPGQAERLKLATETLAKSLAATGRYRIVDLAPYAAAIVKTEPRYNCNGCWRPIAREAGAEVAVLAAVHKVSSLISSLDISIVDVGTGKSIATASGQFRGDTDEAYRRSIAFLVKDRLDPREVGN